eukprot:Skav204835  [mRNA]  locus=scaffold2524:100978:114747:- [translate_table: standard]
MNASRTILLGGHKAGIYALAVSDRLVASGAKDGSILTWNLTGAAMQDASRAMETPLQKLTGHTAGITALSLREPLLASGAADNSTKLWDLATGELVRQLPHPKTVFGLSISGKQLASACWDGVARVYDLEKDQEPVELHGHTGGLYEVSHSPLDPTLLATASADRTVRVWDLKTGRQLWKFMHKDHVTALDWSPVNFTLASGGWDRRFRLWRIGLEEVAKCRASGACGELVPGLVGILQVYRTKVSAGMDRKVLIYSAMERSDDMPVGDKDDDEESRLVIRCGWDMFSTVPGMQLMIGLNWLHDLEDLRGGNRNASSIADFARELARNRSKTRGSKTSVSKTAFSRHAMPGVAFL